MPDECSVTESGALPCLGPIVAAVAAVTHPAPCPSKPTFCRRMASIRSLTRSQSIPMGAESPGDTVSYIVISTSLARSTGMSNVSFHLSVREGWDTAVVVPSILTATVVSLYTLDDLRGKGRCTRSRADRSVMMSFPEMGLRSASLRLPSGCRSVSQHRPPGHAAALSHLRHPPRLPRTWPASHTASSPFAKVESWCRFQSSWRPSHSANACLLPPGTPAPSFLCRACTVLLLAA